MELFIPSAELFSNTELFSVYQIILLKLWVCWYMLALSWLEWKSEYFLGITFCFQKAEAVYFSIRGQSLHDLETKYGMLQQNDSCF